MGKIIAIDQAARQSGYAVFNDGNLIFHGIINPSPKNAKGGRRLASLEEQFTTLISNNRPDKVVIEPPFGEDEDKGHRTLRELSKIAGLIELICYKLSVEIAEMPAASWQNICGIHRREREFRKAGARTFCIDNLNMPNNLEQDEYDAACIGFAYLNPNYEEKGAF